MSRFQAGLSCSDWVAAKEAALANKEAALEHELKMSKTNLVTQNIRYSYQAMGDFMYAKGNYNVRLRPCHSQPEELHGFAEFIIDHKISSHLRSGRLTVILDYHDEC